MIRLLGLREKRAGISDLFGAALAVWIFAFSAIIPSLDRELLGSELAIESEHDDSCAHLHHDHTICVQFGKQPWSKGTSIPLEVFPPAPGESVSVRHEAPVEVLRRIPTRSRAPPDIT